MHSALVLMFSIVAGAAVGFITGMTYPEEEDRRYMAGGLAVAGGAICALIALSIVRVP